MNWETISAVGGVAALLTAGAIYGSVKTRLETVERQLRDAAKHAEVLLVFEEIKRRLGRIEEHFDRSVRETA